MIVDLAKFVAAEEPYWVRLEKTLERRQRDFGVPLSLAEAKELDYLYRRAGADLARVASFSAEPEMRRRLELLVGRAYAEIHGTRRAGAARLRPWHWLSATFPQTLRRHARALLLTVVVTLVGTIFGGVAVAVDPEAKEALMPFSHLQGSPADRVAEEEAAMKDRMAGHKATFAGELMTHNTRVSLFALALGFAWGAGTIVLLFYNGVILGAVVADYLQAGQGVFLAGWLLPHGVIEIPAILVGATGGFVLARAVIGRDDGRPLAARLRAVADDVATLAAGTALMLVWAGVVEAYLSQYHEPAIPYALKIAFGVVEFGLLVAYLGWVGRGKAKEAAP